MLVINLNQCLGKLTYTVPRECLCAVKVPPFTLKIRRAGTDCYTHEFGHDERDGDKVTFYLDKPVRELAIGYWQADLFAGCDWIGESTLVKSLPTVTAVVSESITSADVGCNDTVPVCCPTVPPVLHYAEFNQNAITSPGCNTNATPCC